MSTVIAGIGTALPPHRISQEDAALIARKYACESPSQERLFAALYRRAGVEGRGCVVLDRSDGPLEGRQTFYGEAAPSTLERMRRYEAEAGPLGLLAAKAALDAAGIPPGRVTHLITVSCSGFHAPGLDVTLIGHLPLRAEAARTHVGFMGCHGALNGLRVADAFLRADPDACVLLCALELCSLHHQYGWDAERIVSNSLFADGAAAVVAVPEAASAGVARASRRLRLVASGSTLIADSEDAMSWRIGDHGFQMTLSNRVPDLIGTHLRPWLESWLARHGLDLASVGSWAVHPGGPRILSAVAEALGLGHDALGVSQRVLAEHGNMSSPTILFILDRLARAGAPGPCVALAFGPGLAVEAAILD
ncbi:Alpha-pyrone synthesis polyketide synthase-like Pks18 [Aquisphaera giovannonii]|uniref:Alpha-pyrone synthesis polyketide synthase-like Pks18 n=1 Tax=Aquisphaera giovannonii TaxID=406548 RepID=A0A5B9W939_9BACT|nr:type III polyketide synthase [Aquisphaera giovannonii]QEH36814.1 Alpha-pyrone synthesis polyketide synthase-like Pks18 [Aquisphaera giovannonii]